MIKETKLSHNEVIKAAIPTLAGQIAATLSDPSAQRFSEDDTQFLKFHGIYQQDDRDLRKTGKHYIFMVRGRLPGGVVPPQLYAVFDELATRYGNQTLRVTSRQGFQFHGVVKEGLGKLMRGINDALATTLAACGDVNRNVMAPPTPSTSPLVDRVQQDARIVSDALLPQTRAYHSIWVEGVQLNLEDPANKDFEDPLYGKTYLPRKFKTAFAIPPLNDVDVFTNCLGFVAIGDRDQLHGYNLLAGGGLGMSHGNTATFPRVADVVGFVPPDKLVAAAQAVLKVHRDWGDRTNRKHARLKYVLADRGVDWFRAQVEEWIGSKLEPARPFQFTHQGDLLGWHEQTDGRHFLGLFVETGRIKDIEGHRTKTALREVVDRFGVELRLTPSQNVILTNVPVSQREPITALLAGHGIAVDRQASALRRVSMACPALPTCGLAITESERALPSMLDELEQILQSLNLADEEIVVRSTGCPNGCARPYTAEIGLVGKAPGKYQLYLGGDGLCTRLNRLYRDAVKQEDIINELRPLLTRFAGERLPGERFGPFCERVLWTDSAPALAPA